MIIIAKLDLARRAVIVAKRSIVSLLHTSINGDLAQNAISMKHLDIPPPQMNVHLGLGHNFIKEIAKLSKEEVRNLYPNPKP